MIVTYALLIVFVCNMFTKFDKRLSIMYPYILSPSAYRYPATNSAVTKGLQEEWLTEPRGILPSPQWPMQQLTPPSVHVARHASFAMTLSFLRVPPGSLQSGVRTLTDETSAGRRYISTKGGEKGGSRRLPLNLR